MQNSSHSGSQSASGLARSQFHTSTNVQCCMTVFFNVQSTVTMQECAMYVYHTVVHQPNSMPRNW